MKTKILVTGANGYIGRHVLSALITSNSAAELHAIRSPFGKLIPESIENCNWHTVDLLDTASVHSILKIIRPTHVIHAAWVTTHGIYWNSDENHLWLNASIGLLDEFIRNGGHRFIQIGTCAEYDWSAERLIEGFTLEKPSSLYGQCKLAFHNALLDRIEQGLVSAANGRVFFTYGPFENPARLVPSACRALIDGRRVEFDCGSLLRDYMHIVDLATSIVCLTKSTLNGAVNLGSGEPIRLFSMLEELGSISQRPDLLVLKNQQPESGTNPPTLIADTRRIRGIGWMPTIDLRDGLTATYRWWQSIYATPVSKTGGRHLPDRMKF